VERGEAGTLPAGVSANIERFLDFARNDRREIGDIRTSVDKSFRSLRKFSPVVFRPAVAGLLECARVLASLSRPSADDLIHAGAAA